MRATKKSKPNSAVLLPPRVIISRNDRYASLCHKARIHYCTFDMKRRQTYACKNALPRNFAKRTDAKTSFFQDASPQKSIRSQSRAPRCNRRKLRDFPTALVGNAKVCLHVSHFQTSCQGANSVFWDSCKVSESIILRFSYTGCFHCENSSLDPHPYHCNPCRYLDFFPVSSGTFFTCTSPNSKKNYLLYNTDHESLWEERQH